MNSVKLLIFFAFLSTICAFKITPSISDGLETDIKEFPFLISIQQSTLQLCTGVLITNKFALSSARCMSRRNIPQLVVEFGNTVINPGVRDGPNNVGISEIIFHPDFNYTTYENDICIIQLQNEINLDGFYEPFAHLSVTGSRFQSGTIGTHAGWGATLANVTNHQLHRADVTIISHSECITAVGESKQPFFQNICAMDKSVVCTGDMGAPLLINRILVGITSFRNGELCVNIPGQFPNVYTAISFYISWIESVIGERFTVNTFLSRN
ncbi:hypothetical protein PVAND_000215 [Polypedilum vanderplanki]|uniref:Peptidase S1 domain-containing protein n=1 Tax=Polypedilum vanderplanki TaxID=319348 RepID=A0A9J6BJE3_POLVA|nr:hypothetical protein PVAND_000215 [Polypedilum vanderplanki]